MKSSCLSPVDDHVDNKSGSAFKNNMTLSWNQEAQCCHARRAQP